MGKYQDDIKEFEKAFHQVNVARIQESFLENPHYIVKSLRDREEYDWTQEEIDRMNSVLEFLDVRRDKFTNHANSIMATIIKEFSDSGWKFQVGNWRVERHHEYAVYFVIDKDNNEVSKAFTDIEDAFSWALIKNNGDEFKEE